MEGIVNGAKTVPDLINYLKADARLIPAGKFRLNFTTNHDKNAFEGTTREKLGAGVDAFTVLTFTVPGMPLIYNGQEGGAEHRLNLFDHDPIVWHGDSAANLYRTLAGLKRNNFALWDGVESAPIQFWADADTRRSLLVFKREACGDSVVVMLNLDSQPAKVRVPAAVTQMKMILEDDDSSPDQDGELVLPPWGYRVWSNSG
jgi:1,4-alpha-glucan branching enzyme